MTGNTSNHHRYGEVKTRLTIRAGADFTGLSTPRTTYVENGCQKPSALAE